LSAACERKEQDQEVGDMKDVVYGEGGGGEGGKIRLLNQKIEVKYNGNIQKGVKSE
jgi:hypothetical protein